MAAEIKSKETSDETLRKPILVGKIEGINDLVTGAVFIPGEDGIITVSEDRSIRVWLKRDTGLYWPSICHYVADSCSAMFYSPETRRLFVGLNNGTIMEFLLSDDLNRIALTRQYPAHQGRVTSLHFSPECELVLSCGRDKFFQWHGAETGQRLGGYSTSAWCTSITFDVQSRTVFIGDYSGGITLLKIKNDSSTFHIVSSLKGHSGCVRCLKWDPEAQVLFSASFDKSIVVWDIGGQKGIAYELQGHRDKVQAIAYSGASKQLLSVGSDSTLGVWNMAAKRKETPEWSQNDYCEKCKEPFFWNVRAMWELRKVGKRQHHCRRCGKAVCDECSQKRSVIPIMGHEAEVRVCNECFAAITDEDRLALASFHDVKQNVIDMDLDAVARRMLTVGADRVIKLWDVTSILAKRAT